MTERLGSTTAHTRASMRDAIEALRAESGHTHDADATRRRIVGSIVHKKRRRRQAIALIAIVFVVFPLGTTAYAAFFGTPAFVQDWFAEPVAPPAPIAPAQRARRMRPAKPIAVSTATATQTPIAAANVPAEPASIPSSSANSMPTASANSMPTASANSVPPASATTTADTTREAAPVLPKAPSQPRRASTAATPTRLTEVAPARVVDPSDALYTRAHELHFIARDPAAALDAWNAYLLRSPNATLAPEATYNRALCLVRLRRNAEAIEALTPFANGENGGYRKREATALLQALNH